MLAHRKIYGAKLHIFFDPIFKINFGGEVMIIEQKELLHSGKANDVYLTDDEKFYIIDHTNRISAGNGKKTGIIPGKG